MTRKIFTALSGSNNSGRGRFFYPRHGYGQISEAYHRGAREAGAEFHLSARVQSVEIENAASQGSIETVTAALARSMPTRCGRPFQLPFSPNA